MPRRHSVMMYMDTTPAGAQPRNRRVYISQKGYAWKIIDVRVLPDDAVTASAPEVIILAKSAQNTSLTAYNFSQQAYGWAYTNPQYGLAQSAWTDEFIFGDFFLSMSDASGQNGGANILILLERHKVSNMDEACGNLRLLQYLAAPDTL